jgi:hypothetical protein
MTDYVPAAIRRQVYARAQGKCEYCLLPQATVAHPHESDHIVPVQHGGETTAENLALACMRCNRHKGPNVGSYDPAGGQLVAFFNPRTQMWREHFGLDGGQIVPLTAAGRVTVKILQLNDPRRVAEREALIKIGLYPY